MIFYKIKDNTVPAEMNKHKYTETRLSRSLGAFA